MEGEPPPPPSEVYLRVNSRKSRNVVLPVEIAQPLPSKAAATVEHKEMKHFKKWVPWLIPIFVIANVFVFIITMYVNNCPETSSSCIAKFLGRFSFQPFHENPLLGPSTWTWVFVLVAVLFLYLVQKFMDIGVAFMKKFCQMKQNIDKNFKMLISHCLLLWLNYQCLFVYCSGWRLWGLWMCQEWFTGTRFGVSSLAYGYMVGCSIYWQICSVF